MPTNGINIFASLLSGCYALVIFVLITKLVPIKQQFGFFGIFNNPSFHSGLFAKYLRYYSDILYNKWLVLAFLLYTFGFIKHEIGYYLTIESNYCEKTNVCAKLAKQTQPTWIDRFKATFGFLENIWIENVGEGILFILVGLPLFVFMENKLIAAFLTGVLADIVAEYTGIHKYFCKTTCNVNPLTSS
jgi:hypothetical protein